MSPYIMPVNKNLKNMVKHKSQHRNLVRESEHGRNNKSLKHEEGNISYYRGIVAAWFLLAVITLI